jgi:hypothetical protein
MVLVAPGYIERMGFADSPITHGWDDDDPAFAYLDENHGLRRTLSTLSDRAVLAYCAGCAEWVRWRFSSVSADPMLAQVIEAVWAGIADLRYLDIDALPRHPYSSSHPEWMGPVRGPMRAAAGLLREAVDLVRRGTFAYPEAECLAYLTRYVLPDTAPFRRWQRVTLRRLARWYPRPDGRRHPGAPVPRQAVDSQCRFEAAQAERMLADFLRALNPAANPYLRSGTEGSSGNSRRIPRDVVDGKAAPAEGT